MKYETWRQRADKVIAEVIADNQGATKAELRRLIFDAYPFGPRKHHPYKAWLKAVARAIGESPKEVAARRKREAEIAAQEGQGRMFLDHQDQGETN